MIVICGPTASGKTELALRLALEKNGSIINADTGQLYRGMDIGTAKPSSEERGQVPFHLIDVIDPPARFSAAAFRREALRFINEIKGRGRVPIVVGGTGLYIRALTRGLFEGPGRDPGLRDELARRIEAEGLPSLYQELQEKDPRAAAKIHPNDQLRIVRALEVIYLTGRPISDWQTEWSAPGVIPAKAGIHPMYAIHWPREELYRRVDERVERMLAKGWIDETRSLVKRWGADAYALQQCIGYREIIAHLRGDFSREAMAEKIKRRTRHYAKRQLTWFRRETSIQWLEGRDDLSSLDIACTTE